MKTYQKDRALRRDVQALCDSGAVTRGAVMALLEKHRVMTPAEVAQLGAIRSWENTKDRSARTANARAAMKAKFLREADGDPVLAAELRREFYAAMGRARWGNKGRVK